MEVVKGRIKRCTEAELFMFWLKRWSDTFDFYSYKKACQENGVEIITEEEEEWTKKSKTDFTKQ